MSDQKLIEACSALYTEEPILHAGAFQPRGTQGVMMLGPAGVLAGRFLAKNSHLPRFAIIAVTASQILMFRAENIALGWKPAELVSKFPRSSTKVTVQPGVQVRKLTLDGPDGPDGAVRLESPRLGAWHGAAVIAALNGAS